MSRSKLKEGISDIVFHFTNLKNGYKILTNNKFILTPTLGTAEAHLSKFKHYYLSTTRSKHGHFHKSFKSGVMFRLDGTKIANTLSGVSLEYFSQNSPIKELEDRVISDKPELVAHKYITEVDVLLDPKEKILNEYVYLVYVFCKNNGIPVNVYYTMKDLNLSNKSNTLPHDFIMDFKKNNMVSNTKDFDDSNDLEDAQSDDSDTGDITRLINIALEQDPIKYDLKTKELVYYIKNEPRTFFNGILADFKVLRKKSSVNPESRERGMINKLTQLMGVYKAKDFNDLLDKVVERVSKKK